MDTIVKQFLDEVSARNQNEPEFMQAVAEVAETVIPYIVQHDIYYGQNILLRVAEPERVLHRCASKTATAARVNMQHASFLQSGGQSLFCTFLERTEDKSGLF